MEKKLETKMMTDKVSSRESIEKKLDPRNKEVEEYIGSFNKINNNFNPNRSR